MSTFPHLYLTLYYDFLNYSDLIQSMNLFDISDTLKLFHFKKDHNKNKNKRSK